MDRNRKQLQIHVVRFIFCSDEEWVVTGGIITSKEEVSRHFIGIESSYTQTTELYCNDISYHFVVREGYHWMYHQMLNEGKEEKKKLEEEHFKKLT